MSEEFIVTPLGLMTQANKIGVYPAGAMSNAAGLVMRSPGYLEPFKVATELIPQVAVPSSSSYVLCVFPIGNGMSFIVRASTATLPNSADVWFGNSVSQLVGATPNNNKFNRARVRPFLFRNRLYAMASNGLMVWDTIAPSNLAERTGRWAQLAQPMIIGNQSSGSGVPSLGSGKAVSFAVLLRRVYSDGYELVSALSPIQRAYNSNAAALPWQVTAGFDPAQAGDIIELYRSKEANVSGLGLNVNPGTTMFLVKTKVLTAAQTVITIFDTAAPNQVVGREAYTNPGQETLQSNRFIPPVSQCTAEFKGYVFYGNILLPGQWVAAWPGGQGVLTTADQRTAGVGVRPLTSATFTIGNNVITAVPAASMVGLQVGMYLYDGNNRIPGNPATTKITALGATTITMSVNALASGTFTTAIAIDAVEVDGLNVPIGDMQQLFFMLGQGFGFRYNVVADEPFTYGNVVIDPELTYGQRIGVSPYRALQNSYGVSVRGTSPNNYDPVIPDILATAQNFPSVRRKNLLQWSWEQQPESCAAAAYAFIGSGEIYALATTRDVMWIFASDGLWRFTGYGTRPSGIQANFRVDLIDRTLKLAGPNAFAPLREAVFAYTNIGFVKISDAVGVQAISRGLIADLLPGRAWVESEDITLAADEVQDEVWINVLTGDLASSTAAVTTYVWQDQYGIFTTLNQNTAAAAPVMTLAYDTSLSAMLQGVGQRNNSFGPIVFWHNPATTLYEAYTEDYQPVYGPDPGSSKQWDGMTLIFDKASAGFTPTPRFNGIAYTGSPLVLYSNTLDARANFGVDIEAPAFANILAPGLSMPRNNGFTRMRGLLMRYSTIDEQPVFR